MIYRTLLDKELFLQMPNGLLAVWLDIPDEQRNMMGAEFQDIFELSCEKGFRAIMDEAEFHLPGDELSLFAAKMSAYQITMGGL